ncbi:MAG: PEP-utilizing enzyme, partial [Candidatus Electryoneaceae bacterium]|nr:PEP-utilizing enzyme [Candidatus Electryoneaceae bacterium]
KVIERLEAYYETGQDIEWAIDENGEIIILQCRPLAQVSASIEDSAIENDNDYDANVILSDGVTASPGSASGPVFVVRWEKQALHFPDGAILVTSQALPCWAMLLNRASAVITEGGTITSHLANVSREFGVPAIFEMKNATEILKTGQVVTVNANTRKVYGGQVDTMLKVDVKPRNLMQGNVVFETLQSVAQNINPLNLLDPDMSSFNPGKCKTLHDITRFCHEKSVQEIFDFGKKHHFRQGSSKQLYIGRPLKWWVLNLDDGFDEEIKGKYVKLDDIVSLPMLALWKGITWKQWEGPPPVDGKGLMSVMFQATANTSITESTATQYADRNYFMISKNFCNLTSRLGFHFTIVEAMVGEILSDNYITFQFKGGAADIERKLGRLGFLKDILTDYDFHVEIRGDYLRARLDDLDEKTMLRRLSLIGHLIIHTRQLDMIMTNPTTVSHYKTKIGNDLKEIGAC